MNLQVIADPRGDILWVSGAESPARHTVYPSADPS
jgi:hypothetical protein